LKETREGGGEERRGEERGEKRGEERTGDEREEKRRMRLENSQVAGDPLSRQRSGFTVAALV
jgi:hypothetical protein